MSASRYLHVPFCLRKCPYCDFNSYAEKHDLLDAYAEALKAEIRLGASPVESGERLTGRSAMGETMFLWLLMLRAVDESAFSVRHGISPTKAFGSEIADLRARELLARDNGSIRLIEKGLLLADEVFMQFVWKGRECGPSVTFPECAPV